MDDGDYRPSRLIAANLAWAATALVFVLASLKVLIVAHMDYVTALGLIAKTSVSTTLLGSFILFLPPLIYFLHIILIAGKFHADGSSFQQAIEAADANLVGKSGRIFLVPILVTGLVVLPFTPLFGFPILISLYAAFIRPGPHPSKRASDRSLTVANSLSDANQELKRKIATVEKSIEEEDHDPQERANLDQELGRLREELANVKPTLAEELERDRRQFLRLSAAVWGFIILLAVLTLAVVLSDRVWLPPERITSTSDESWIGYVADESESAILLLDDGSRTLRRIPLAVVESRKFCRLGEQRRLYSLVEFIFDDDGDYPVCLSDRT